MSVNASSQLPPVQISEPFPAILDEIRRTTCFFGWENPPADDFDPRTADDDLLKSYGLPPRPDKVRFPVRYAFWMKMFTAKKGAPVKLIRSTFEYEHVERVLQKDVEAGFQPAVETDNGLVTVKAPRRADARRGPPPRRLGKGVAAQDTSTNWCGAYVTAHDGRIITEIHGSWKVPQVDVPSGVGLNELELGEELRCSSWLGLDGQRGYLNASLPQIGTSHFVQKGLSLATAVHGVWWQWWLRGVPNPPPIKLPLKVRPGTDDRPGDEIMASLFVVDSTHVIYLIANHTTGEVCTPFKVLEPSAYLAPDLPGRPVRVSGATGEWITERPVNWTTGRSDRLPFYGQVYFEDCHIVLGRAPHVDELEERPRGTLLIRAIRVDRDPPRAMTIARAKRHGRMRFSTRFLGTPTDEAGGIFSAAGSGPTGSAPSSLTGP